MRPPAAVLVAPGTNRDRDMIWALEAAGADPEPVLVQELVEGTKRLADYRFLAIAGGFSYGDDLGAGKLLALDLELRIADQLREFVASGRPVLGVCNGFQALVKAGVLPGWRYGKVEATLAPNASGRFECRWVRLRPNPTSPCVFTRGLSEEIFCPVAHGEGRFLPASEEVLRRLREEGLIALTYAGPDPEGPAPYPYNPNGSVADIGGITNPQGNVLGMMPHPEDHILPWQHPRQGRGEEGNLGLELIRRGVAYAAEL